MHYTNILQNFQLEYDDFESLKDQDDPEAPSISHKDADHKAIKWETIFKDYMYRTFGSCGPLEYVLCDEPAVPTEVVDLLQANSYFGASGSILDELVIHILEQFTKMIMALCTWKLRKLHLVHEV